MNKGRKNLLEGSKAEAFAINKLIKMGLSVSTPIFKQCKYDCIVDDDSDLYRVQIKKISQHYRKNNRISTKLASGHYNSNGKMETELYSEEEIDAYILVDLKNDNCFWLFFDEAPSTSITISYKRGRKEDNVNYYKDFLIENKWETINNGNKEDSEDLSGSVFEY